MYIYEVFLHTVNKMSQNWATIYWLTAFFRFIAYSVVWKLLLYENI